jgi:predicted amidohydrolase
VTVDRRTFLAGAVAAPSALAGSVAARAHDAPGGEPSSAAGRTVRVGMAQMLVRTGAVDENLARARERIAQAGREGCAVVVLPECLDLGWTHPEAPKLARPIPGPSSDALGEAARAAGVWVVAGLTERDGEKTHNTAVLIDAGGRLRLEHRKINELDIAWSLYERGTALEVADTPFGRVAIPICADNSTASTELGLALGRMGARLLLSPCAWAVVPEHDDAKEPYGRDLWDVAYRLFAEKQRIATVAVSNVGWMEAGPWKGRRCIGSSLCVGPDGAVIARLPYGVDADVFRAVDVPLAG